MEPIVVRPGEAGGDKGETWLPPGRLVEQILHFLSVNFLLGNIGNYFSFSTKFFSRHFFTFSTLIKC